MPYPEPAAPALDAAGLRAWREAHGLSIRALAALLAASPNTIHRWETGEREITTPVAQHLALERLDQVLAEQARKGSK